MAAGGVGEMEEEESAEDLTPVVKDWMRTNYIKGEVAEEEAEQVDNFENAIANPETDEEQMEEEEGGREQVDNFENAIANPETDEEQM